MTQGHDGDPVRAHFGREADYWSSIYEDESDPAGAVYRQRLERMLAYVDRLGIEPPAPVADVGAGAGLASVALATRGHRVLAVDSTRRMLDLTQARADRAGVAIELVEADAAELPLEPASVDLVVALGLLPWVTEPERILAEFRRVLRPGGGLIVTADNRWRATELADPSLSPLLSPLGRFVVRPLRRYRGRLPVALEPRRHSVRALDRLLREAGFDVVAVSTVGYSPLSFRRRALRGRAATALERLLAANASKPVLRSGGVHVVAAARLARP